MSSNSLHQASEALGLSVPVIQFLVGFIATLPLSWGWRLMPKESPSARHWYAAITGALVSHYALPPGSNLLLLLPIAMSYASMLFWRRRSGVVTFILAFGFLLACHVHFMSGESWKRGGIDATGALMVITLKVISATTNYQDGLLTENVKSLRPAQKKYRIFDLPSPITYLGYCLNCGTHLAGPVYELKDYIDWTEHKYVWSCEDVPPYLVPSLQAVARSLLCMGIYMFLSPHFSSLPSVSTGIDQPWSPWKTLGFFWMCGFTARWKFYFIWSISEASLILSGFGFSGWDSQEGKLKHAKWDQARNVDIPRVEFNGSGAQLPHYWNIHVGSWLRHYVYEPLSGNGRGGLVQLVATQAVAAVWHGLYTGYLLFFVHSALMIAGARVIYKWQLWINPEWNTSPPDNRHIWVFGSKWELKFPRSVGMWSLIKQALGWAIGFSYASAVLHYSWAGFLLLNFRDTLSAYHSMYYAGTILPLLVILLGKVVRPPRLKKLEKKE